MYQKYVDISHIKSDEKKVSERFLMKLLIHDYLWFSIVLHASNMVLIYYWQISSCIRNYQDPQIWAICVLATGFLVLALVCLLLQGQFLEI